MTDSRNYVAAWYDWNKDNVVVIERDTSGNRFKKVYNAPYYFYVEDPDGKHESIFGDKLSKVELSSRDEFEEAKKLFKKRFESDIRPLNRVLMDNYYEKPAPPVTYALFDIETDYKKELGFSGPSNPYAAINAVTVYQSWTKKFITYAIPPTVDGVRWDEIGGNTIETVVNEIKDLIASKQLREGIYPEIYFCRDEKELLSLFADSIEDADIISGWNSDYFDIPYICERMFILGGNSFLARLEYPGLGIPKKQTVTRFGSPEIIYKFYGRAHLDYMQLFQKFTFEGRTSYALGNILQEEVGIGKIEFDGTLEQLYNNNFPKFLAYNFRDTDGLVQLDDKFKFMSLTNQMAHENTVLFNAVLGTVAYVETGITNHAHYKLNKIVRDKNIVEETEKVEGAIVLSPKVGLHEWVGSVDIESLYPSVARSLNLSIETMLGQFTNHQDEADWEKIKSKSDEHCTIIWTNGKQDTKTGKEWNDFLREKNLSISAYGTVFDQNMPGLFSDTLSFWFKERKKLKSEKNKWTDEVAKLKTSLGFSLSDKDAATSDKIKSGDLIQSGNKVYTSSEWAQIENAVKNEEHFDLLQLTKKISLNSAYGALLSAAFRFGCKELGASITSSGRRITKHMIETIEYLQTGAKKSLNKSTIVGDDGKRQMIYEIDSESVIYSDTDSAYFLCLGVNDEDTAVEMANATAKYVNESFFRFMSDSFLCNKEYAGLIKANREIVARRMLLQAKKKYICKVFDLDGRRVDKLKSMGSEIKKADTPKVIQKFLKQTVDMILNGKGYSDVASFVNGQRQSILKGNGSEIFSMGVAKQVNNMDKFLAEYNNPGSLKKADGKKLAIPGHVRAALNYNHLIHVFDKGSKSIRSGDKVLVFYLKDNDFKFETIAIPAEMTKFPSWFNEHFKVDGKKTESKMFDSKLEGIFKALGKEVPSPQSMLTQSILEF